MKSLAPFLALAAFVALVLGPLPAQQPNASQASFVFNSANGPPWPYAVTVQTSQQATLTFTISGAPNAGYALVETPGVVSPGASTPFGLLDVDLSQGFQILMDGLFFSTGTIFDYLANTTPSGTSTWTVSLGTGAAGYQAGLQCLVADPTSPAGFRLTAAAIVSIIVNVPPTSAIFVSATTGAPGNPGTQASPLSTIADGIAAAWAAGAPYPTVVVAGGSYTSATPLALANGVSVSGGYDPVSWIQSGAAVTTLTVSDPTAVVASQISAMTTVSDVTIVGANNPGGSAYGVLAADSSGLTLQNCVIYAAAGGAGSSGSSPGGTAAAGANGALGQPGCENSGGVCSTCPQPIGGNGGSSPFPGGSGGPGGPADDRSASGNPGGPGGGGAPGGPGTPPGGGNWNTPSLYWGANGANGANGADGSGGALAYLSSGFAPANGAAGGTGGPGAGGGGGGGGGGGTTNCDSYGGGGGGGGAGGAPGVGGGGGASGGGSFAIYLWNSNVTIDSCELHAGNGGGGGNGGSGQAGGAGGQGGHLGGGAGNSYGGGAGQDDGSNGGRGGDGGTGGSGGGGGGGAGGPSWCVLTAGGSAPVVLSTTFFVGTPGVGGAGGLSGSGQSSAPNGASGTSGQVGS